MKANSKENERRKKESKPINRKRFELIKKLKDSNNKLNDSNNKLKDVNKKTNRDP